jgi:hypothetical protein
MADEPNPPRELPIGCPVIALGIIGDHFVYRSARGRAVLLCARE